ncbi:hypothetical protein ABN702_05360 [Bacillus haimaensis]|uniref:hypothetical protein n=1 Tax=Bacillus haimaensis TaxID=3160967 RepID=UPI003AA94767
MGIFFEDASKQSRIEKVLMNIIFVLVSLKLINRFFFDYTWVDSFLFNTLTIVGILFIVVMIIESKKNKRME